MLSEVKAYSKVLGQWFEWAAFFILIVALFLAYHSRAIPELTALYDEAPYINYGWHIFLTRFLITLSLTLTLLSVGFKGYLRLPHWQLVISLLIYLAFVIASISVSSYAFASVQAAVNICLWCSGFFIAAQLCYLPIRRTWLISSIYILALAMAIYGILQSLGYYPKYVNLYSSIESFYQQSNHYAGFLDVVIPLSLSSALYQKHWHLRIIFWALTILLLVNLVLTDSRASWLAIGFVCLALFIFWVRSRWRGAGKYFIVTALILLGISGLLVNYLPSIKAPLTNPSTILTDGSLQQRLTFWRVSLVAISEQPWLGWGAGSFIDTEATHRSALSMLELKPLYDLVITYAHNDYLQIAVETGLLSLAAFLWFWLVVLLTSATGYKNFSEPTTYGIIAGLTALLLHGFLESNISIIPATAFLAYVLAGFLHAPKGDFKANQEYERKINY